MATFALVGEAQTDLVALIGHALKRHGMVITAQFWLQSLASNQKKVVLVTPDADTLGTGETYSKVIATLDGEAFVPQEFLRLGLLILGEKKGKAALEASRSGVVNLAHLGAYEDVELYPVPDASTIARSGLLHLTPEDGPDSESYVVTFGAFGHSGAMKPRTLHRSDLARFLKSIPANQSQRAEVTETLASHRSASIVLNGIDLATLYDLGLV
jgi:hypothetical protein